MVLLALPALGDTGKPAVPVKTAAGSKAESHVTAGVEHCRIGHWDVVRTHFIEAEKAGPQSAEAHYNLALVLDKTGDHARATKHFNRAHAVGKSNVEIHHSGTLMKHLKI